MDLFLGISIAFLPLFLIINRYDTTRSAKDFTFLLICAVAILLAGQVKRHYRYLRSVAIFLIVAIFFNSSEMLNANTVMHEIGIIMGALLFVKYYECSNAKTSKYLFDGMMLGALIQGTIGICGYFGIELYFKGLEFTNVSSIGWYYSVAKGAYIFEIVPMHIDFFTPGGGAQNVVGSLGNNNLTASYLCMTIPAFLKRKHLSFLAVIPITALILSTSMMGILPLIAGCLYLINHRYSLLPKWSMYTAAIVAMVTAPFLNIHGADNGRFEFWKQMLSGFSAQHWIFGGGPGWFINQKMRIEPTVLMEQEHNSYLTFLNTYGIIGCAILIPIFIRYLKGRDTDIVVGTIIFIVFCNAYGHFSIQQSTVVLIMLPMLCLGLIKNFK